MEDFRKLAKKFESKLKKIKCFLVDCDGVLTDGKLYWASEEVGFNRQFHALDGFGLKMLQAHGIIVGVISGGDSVGLQRRMANLGVDYVSLGEEDKRQGYIKLKAKYGLQDEEILYFGDEFFDLPILKRVGFAVTTPSASYEIQEVCDYITERKAGDACVREMVDILRYAQNIIPKISEFTDL